MTRLGGVAIALGFSFTAVSPAQEPSERSGIYLETGEAELDRLAATTVIETKSGGAKMLLTQGLAKSGVKAVLEDAAAERRLADANPSFQFHFPASSRSKTQAPRTMEEVMSMSGMADLDGLPDGAKKPDEFYLIRFTPRDDQREAEVGKIGGFSGKMGKGKDALDISIEELAPRVYRVKPKQPLEPGEYGFFWSGQGGGGQVWDFGVDRPGVSDRTSPR